MDFFVTNSEREGTAYHEFFGGKWDGETFWSDSSLYLPDDIFFSHWDFAAAIKGVVDSYDPYGETEISAAEWKEIGEMIRDTDSKRLYDEAKEWMDHVFRETNCFTILGL